jgi:alkylation response protein AidB-like acyl-CoA dehydrogenase
MFSEEQLLLKKLVHEFAEKEIGPVSLKVEREGISKEIIQKMVEKGFMGALAPFEHGGSNLDEASYVILLEELAKYSPSLAFYVLTQNSFIIKFLLKSGSKKLVEEYVPQIATGKINGAIVLEDVLQNSAPNILDIVDNKVIGSKYYVVSSNSNIIFTIAGKENWLFVLDNGFKAVYENSKLGFRGLNFSKIEFNSSFKDENVVMKVNVKKFMEELLNEASLEIAAIAIGMSDNVLNKAIEYSKVRKAFESLLADFQPLAFTMSEYYAELKSLQNYLDTLSVSEPKEKENLMLKYLATEFAKKVAKLSLQVHGGYGYLEDFQIEKYYRDAMALSILTSNFIQDKIKLANLVLEIPSAKI